MSRFNFKSIGNEKTQVSVDDLEKLSGVKGLARLCCSQEKKFTVSVEGNIGCGKSTLLSYFRNFPDIVEPITEPVEKWTNIKGHNGLQLLYEDQKRWSFAFNKYCFLTRLQAHVNKSKCPVKMLERSLFSTRHVFAEHAFKNEILTNVEYAVLVEWFDFIVQTQKVDVDLFVYLRASPEVCYNRIKKRGRKEEAGVPFEFIKELHDLHEDWLMSPDSKKLPGPVLVLDASNELPKMEQIYEDHRSQILFGC